MPIEWLCGATTAGLRAARFAASELLVAAGAVLHSRRARPPAASMVQEVQFSTTPPATLGGQATLSDQGTQHQASPSDQATPSHQATPDHPATPNHQATGEPVCTWVLCQCGRLTSMPYVHVQFAGVHSTRYKGVSVTTLHYGAGRVRFSQMRGIPGSAQCSPQHPGIEVVQLAGPHSPQVGLVGRRCACPWLCIGIRLYGGVCWSAPLHYLHQ